MQAHTNIDEAEKIKAAAEVQRLLADMRRNADQPDFKLDLSGTSSKDNAAAETANSQTRRKLLQFGYDPQLLLNEVRFPTCHPKHARALLLAGVMLLTEEA